MDIRRTVLWMIFSFSLLFLWNNWEIHNGKPSMFGQETAATATQSATPGNTPNTSVPSGTAGAVQPGNVPATTAASAAESSAPSARIVVTTDVLRLTFDTTGAQLVHAEVLKYPTDGQPTVLFDRSPASTYVAQTGVVGAPANAPGFPTHLTPFHLVSTQLDLTGDKLPITFEAESGGLKVTKTYTLHRGSYDIDVRNDLTNTGTAPLTPSLYLQLERDGNDPVGATRFYHTFTGMAVYSEQDKFQKIDFSDIEKNKANYIKKADNGWIGVVQHYFAAAWIPPQGQQRTIDVLQVQPNLYAIRTVEPVGQIAPNSTASVDAHLWVGPQDQKAMAAAAPGLDLVVDYGWVTIVAKPLFKLMTWLHTLIGNWGWTIVALTVLIKAVFFPLTAASYKSMARMKAVAPRMQTLKERYGDDRAKLNAAMMEMYRTEKINPLGGCLPMVIQIPVFFALYWVLLSSVEMRGAPWIFWVHDLSVPDPLYILPAVMMGTMFLQLKFNPKPPDPMQAKVMMFMPLVFGAVMFFAPAGLAIYYCVNNSLSILQQWTITRGLAKRASTAANN